MITDMEKNAQIGELVQLKQSQKSALEHLKLKSKKIAAAYSAFGHNQDRWMANEATGSREVFLRFPKGEESQYPQNLLAQAELSDHIREVKAAEQALAATIAQLSNLGITD